MDENGACFNRTQPATVRDLTLDEDPGEGRRPAQVARQCSAPDTRLGTPDTRLGTRTRDSAPGHVTRHPRHETQQTRHATQQTRHATRQTRHATRHLDTRLGTMDTRLGKPGTRPGPPSTFAGARQERRRARGRREPAWDGTLGGTVGAGESEAGRVTASECHRRAVGAGGHCGQRWLSPADDSRRDSTAPQNCPSEGQEAGRGLHSLSPPQSIEGDLGVR